MKNIETLIARNSATQKMAQTLKESEFEVSPTKGIKVSGPITIIVITMLFILALKYIQSGQAKTHAKKAGTRIKSRLSKVFKKKSSRGRK